MTDCPDPEPRFGALPWPALLAGNRTVWDALLHVAEAGDCSGWDMDAMLDRFDPREGEFR